MILTKKQAVEEHRKMWNWIADETLKRKQIVTKEMYFDDVYSDDLSIPKNKCFCCEYVEQLRKEKTKLRFMPCNYLCLIKWGGKNNFCSEYDSLFIKWLYSSSYEEAAEYARMIAESAERMVQDTYLLYNV